jgi:TonB family protein
MIAATSRYGSLGILVSIAVHFGIFAALSVVPRELAPPPLGSVVEFEVPPPDEAPAEPPAPPPPIENPAEPVVPAAAARAAPAVEPEPERESKPQAASEAPVADLTGMTLTNEAGDSSWGSRVGNGSALNGPLRSERRVKHVSVTPDPEPVSPARGPSVVPIADLSKRPVPPKLDGVLERHYPLAARQQGKSGTAIVRLRIDADGQVRKANIVSESETGFGNACRSTVLGSVWSPPQDQQGNRVATFVSYTCRFRVD